jgi:hypothetical protein
MCQYDMAKPVAASRLGISDLGITKPSSLRRCPTAYISGMLNVPVRTETNLKEKTEMLYSCKAEDCK